MGDDGGLTAAGIIFGLLFPIVGFAIAVWLLVRGRVGPGLGVALTSCVGALAAAALLAG